MPQTSDNALVGQYPITIESKIQVWDDYTKTTFTEHIASQTFSIFVEPCIVTAITATPINDMVYVIGDAGGAVSTPYSFTLSPGCNYSIDVTIDSGAQSFF